MSATLISMLSTMRCTSFSTNPFCIRTKSRGKKKDRAARLRITKIQGGSTQRLRKKHCTKAGGHRAVSAALLGQACFQEITVPQTKKYQVEVRHLVRILPKHPSTTGGRRRGQTRAPLVHKNGFQTTGSTLLERKMKSLGLLTVCAVVEVLKRSGHPAHSQPPRDPRALWSWNITPPHPEPKPNLIVVASLPLFVLLGRRLSFFERRPLDAQPPLPHLVVAPGVLFNGTDQYADALLRR